MCIRDSHKTGKDTSECSVHCDSVDTSMYSSCENSIYTEHTNTKKRTSSVSSDIVQWKRDIFFNTLDDSDEDYYFIKHHTGGPDKVCCFSRLFYYIMNVFILSTYVSIRCLFQ